MDKKENYPYNLLKDLNLPFINPEELSDDQLNGVDEAILQLSIRRAIIIYLRYKEKKTLSIIGEYFSISKERVRQLIQLSLHEMRGNPSNFIRYGHDGYLSIVEYESKKNAIKNAENAKMPIEYMHISQRTLKKLHKSDINTIKELIEVYNDCWRGITTELDFKCKREIYYAISMFGFSIDKSNIYI